MPADRAASAGIVRVPGRGMTDSDYPSISLIGQASHRAISQHAGADLSILRWRGNFVLDGLAPWQEFEWIGSAEVVVRERIVRCMATAANPKTGQRDVDMLKVLKDGYGHTDFGVYAEVVRSGDISRGDTVTVIA